MSDSLHSHLLKDNSSHVILLNLITNGDVQQSSAKSALCQQNSVNMQKAFKPLTDLQFFKFAQKFYPCMIQIEIQQMIKKQKEKQSSFTSKRTSQKSDEVLQQSRQRKMKQHFPPMSPGKNSSIRPKPDGSKVSKDQSMNSLAMDLHNMDLAPKNSQSQQEKSNKERLDKQELQKKKKYISELQKYHLIKPSNKIQLYLKLGSDDQHFFGPMKHHGKRKWPINHYWNHKNRKNQKQSPLKKK